MTSPIKDFRKWRAVREKMKRGEALTEEEILMLPEADRKKAILKKTDVETQPIQEPTASPEVQSAPISSPAPEVVNTVASPEIPPEPTTENGIISSSVVPEYKAQNDALFITYRLVLDETFATQGHGAGIYAGKIYEVGITPNVTSLVFQPQAFPGRMFQLIFQFLDGKGEVFTKAKATKILECLANAYREKNPAPFENAMKQRSRLIEQKEVLFEIDNQGIVTELKFIYSGEKV